MFKAPAYGTSLEELTRTNKPSSPEKSPGCGFGSDPGLLGFLTLHLPGIYEAVKSVFKNFSSVKLIQSLLFPAKKPDEYKYHAP